MGEQRLRARTFPGARELEISTTLMLSSPRREMGAWARRGHRAKQGSQQCCPHSHPESVTVLSDSLAVPKGDVGRIIISQATPCTKCCKQGTGQDIGCQGTMELRGSPSGAGKAEGLGQLCASPCHKTFMQGHILPCPHHHLHVRKEPPLVAGTSKSKVPEELPKKCHSRAAAPLGCRQHVLQESWCSAYRSPRCHSYLPQ